MSLASIVKKTAMALTGLAWLVFLVGHLVGNFLLFKGPDSFNAYAAFLEGTGGALYIAEIGLIAFLGLHIYSGIKVTMENRKARQHRYEVQSTNGKATVFSRSMFIGGILIAVFVVTHVATFKFGDHGGVDGLYGLVIRSFKNPLTVAWYVLAMVAIGMHLSHGIGSSFQTLGVAKSAWRARLRIAGVASGWLIAAGFAILPIWAMIAG